MHEELVCLISADSMYGCIFSRDARDTETLDGSESARTENVFFFFFFAIIEKFK